MEQRRFSGKSQWYHETQSSQKQASVLPLVPEAAQVEDIFLLNLSQSDTWLQGNNVPWLPVARTLSSLLLPVQVETNRLHTLSRYERLSTALTVAQVYGVQRLCDYYAARLAPECSSDSSRESNRRLTQITQFARLLASHPTSIKMTSLTELDHCGLSAEDIIVFNQIIGFVGFQAHTIAVLQALANYPVRILPGLSAQQDADRALFSCQVGGWQPYLRPLERRHASEEQIQALKMGHASAILHKLAPTLAYDSQALQNLGRLIHTLWPAGQPLGDDDLLVMMLVSRMNGSPVCFHDAQAKWQGDQHLPGAILDGGKTLEAWGQHHPRERAIIQAIQLLTRSPGRLGQAQLAPLFAQKFTEQQALHLLVCSALAGWLNRLKIALGSQDKPETLLA